MADHARHPATTAVFDGPDIAGPARTTLRAMLSHVDAPRVAEAVLLLDELITDAARDGAVCRGLWLGLLTGPPRLRIEVTRIEPAAPVGEPRSPGRGRGRLLLDDLASEWSTVTDGARATTWAEVRLPG